MKKTSVSTLQQKEKVNSYFQSQSELLYWKDIYASSGVRAEIIRDRQAAVLNWVDKLALAPGSHFKVLEIGCGAGFMAVALAQRGLNVHAIDSAEAMIEVAKRHAEESGTIDKLSLNVGDAYALAFDDASFDLVIAIGVIPWLTLPELAIREMARVTKPGGYVILTTANRAGLVSFVDPWWNPLLAPVKRRLKAVIEHLKHRQASPTMAFHSRHYIDNALARAGFIKIEGMTRGFEFSFLRHTVLPGPLGTKVHHRLQRFAGGGVPIIKSIGMTYFVLGKKGPS